MRRGAWAVLAVGACGRREPGAARAAWGAQTVTRPPWPRLRVGLLRLATAVALILLAAAPARAWYFPEHAAATCDGLTHLSDDLRAVYERAVTLATGAGVPLCADPSQRLDRTPRRPPMRFDAACIPYCALPALAGDHATSAADLEAATRNGSGAKVVGATISVWRDLLRGFGFGGTVTERSVTAMRDLDVLLGKRDHAYVSRAKGSMAHFHDQTRSIQELLDALAARGDTDNALAQFVGNHLASLQTASRVARAPAQQEARLATRALMLHATALHFLQDAFAGGHMAPYPGCCGPMEGVKRRHDYYNAQGVLARSALAAPRCTAEPEESTPEEVLVSRCFIAKGDGYLMPWTVTPSRVVLAEAVARVQLQFALALGSEPRHELTPVEAELLNPRPSWSLGGSHLAEGSEASVGNRCDATRSPPPAASAGGSSTRNSPTRSQSVTRPMLERFHQALEVLSAAPDLPEVTSNNSDGESGWPLTAGLVGRPLDWSGNTGCSDKLGSREAEQTGRGRVDESILRPLLAAWPLAVDQVQSMTEEALFENGFGWQLLLSLRGGAAVGCAPERTAGDLGGGLLAGISYRTANIFPGSGNHPLAEINAGVVSRSLFPGSTRLMIAAEARLPVIVDLVLLGAREIHGDLGGSLERIVRRSGLYVATGGAVYFSSHTDPPQFAGFDIEAIRFSPWGPEVDSPKTRILKIAPEFRLRVGGMYPDLLGLEADNELTFSIALEVVLGAAAVF